MTSRIKIEDFDTLPAGVTATYVDTEVNYLFQTDGYPAPFVANDILLVQRYNPAGSQIIKQIIAEVNEVNGSEVDLSFISSIGEIEEGDTFVRIANPSGTNLMKFNVNGGNTPFIAMMQGVTSYADYVNSNREVVRLGELSGITDELFGPLSGSGLYASVAYIKGALATEDGELVSSQFSVMADAIALKVSQDDFNDLGNRVSAAESSITVNSNAIALKVSQTDFNALGNRVSAAESSITQNANSISSKVSQTDFNDLGNRVSEAESSITQNADSLSSKVSQIDFNDLGNRVSEAESNITQNADSLSSKVSQIDFNALGNRVSEAESSLTQTIDDFTFNFEVIGVDGYERTGKTKITADGVTIYDGALTIMNKSGVNVFHADDNGNLTISGTVNANGGKVGGFNISNSGIVNDDGTAYVICRDTNDGKDARIGTSVFSAVTGLSGVAYFSNEESSFSDIYAIYARAVNSGSGNGIAGKFVGDIEVTGRMNGIMSIPDSHISHLGNSTSYNYMPSGYYLYVGDQKTGNRDYYLPAANAYKAGSIIRIANWNGNDGYFHPRGSDTVNGYADNARYISLRDPADCVWLRSNGSNQWMIIAMSVGSGAF